MAEKLPYMPFYGDDFFLDEEVQLLPDETQILYLRLLWHQWKVGSVPAEDSRLAQLLKSCSSCGPESIACVKRFFDREIDGGTRLQNSRCEDLRKRHRVKRRTDAQHAARAARVRWGGTREKPAASPHRRKTTAGAVVESQAESRAEDRVGFCRWEK